MTTASAARTPNQTERAVRAAALLAAVSMTALIGVGLDQTSSRLRQQALVERSALAVAANCTPANGAHGIGLVL